MWSWLEQLSVHPLEGTPMQLLKSVGRHQSMSSVSVILWSRLLYLHKMHLCGLVQMKTAAKPSFYWSKHVTVAKFSICHGPKLNSSLAGNLWNAIIPCELIAISCLLNDNLVFFYQNTTDTTVKGLLCRKALAELRQKYLNCLWQLR